nr:PREDICTED: uncharacterized oxidoreductase C663.09c-like [Opisthocomus hoazin]
MGVSAPRTADRREARIQSGGVAGVWRLRASESSEQWAEKNPQGPDFGDAGGAPGAALPCVLRKAARLLCLPGPGMMPNSCERSHMDKTTAQLLLGSLYGLRDPSELQQLSKQYSNIKLLQLDVVCENSIKKVVKEVEEIVGDKGLNCLINNAGINVLASLEEVTAETMLTIYETNTVAQLMVTKAFLPLLRKAAQLSTGMGCHRAAIINMSSLAASMQLVQANEMFLKVYPYRIAKTALNMITRCLAADLKSDGILCISLHPGWLQTDMGGNMAPMQVQEAIPGILSVLDRLGEKENGSFLDWQGETLPW